MERPRLGLVSVYFGLFDEQMRAGFRADQERAARGYADLLAAHLDVEIVYPGLLSSDADADRANEVFRSSGPNVLVFAPSMAAPPSYAMRAIEGLDAPVVVWNAPAVDRLPADLTQAQATEHSTQVGCVMAANVLVRQGRPFSAVTAPPRDAAAVDTLVRTVRAALAASLVRGATALRVGEPIAGYLDVEATAEELARLGVSERAITVEELNAAFESIDLSAARSLLSRHRYPRLDVGSRQGRTSEAPGSRSPCHASSREGGARCGTVNCHGPWLRSNEKIGVSACLGVSLLAEQGVPFSCTGDQPTGLALLLARALSGRALYCEFYAPEVATGLMLLAAGGEGDTAWADPSAPVLVEPNHHYPGVAGAGASVSFRLEPGPATALSLSPVLGAWRLAWATGEIVETRYSMGGPNAMFRFDSGPSAECGARWIESGRDASQRACRRQARRRGSSSLSCAPRGSGSSLMETASPEERVRVGVIGCGWWSSQAHLPALSAHPRAVVAGLADPDPAALSRASERFGVADDVPERGGASLAHRPRRGRGCGSERVSLRGGPACPRARSPRAARKADGARARARPHSHRRGEATTGVSS